MPDVRLGICCSNRMPLATTMLRAAQGLPLILFYAELARLLMFAIIAVGLSVLVACAPSGCTNHGVPDPGSTILN